MTEKLNKKKERVEVQKRMLDMMDQGFEVLEKQLEEELQNFYWQHYENSDIISIGQDQQSAKQSFSLSCYERANPSFLSSHSVASQANDQNKYKAAKRSKSINTRSKTLLTKPNQLKRRVKTEQTQQQESQHI